MYSIPFVVDGRAIYAARVRPDARVRKRSTSVSFDATKTDEELRRTYCPTCVARRWDRPDEPLGRPRGMLDECQHCLMEQLMAEQEVCTDCEGSLSEPMWAWYSVNVKGPLTVVCRSCWRFRRRVNDVFRLRHRYDEGIIANAIRDADDRQLWLPCVADSQCVLFWDKSLLPESSKIYNHNKSRWWRLKDGIAKQ